MQAGAEGTTLTAVSSRAVFVIALAACLGLAVIVGATVGGASRIEVLGYSAEYGKVYFLQGTNLELDALHFIRVKGASAGKTVFLKNYYDADGFESTDFEAFEQRLSKLKKRIKKLKPVRTSKGEPNENKPRRELSGFKMERKVLRRWWDADFDVPCREVTLTIVEESTKFSGTLTTKECFYARGRYRVTKAYKLPETPGTLVVLSGVRDPFEGGYVIERLALLR